MALFDKLPDKIFRPLGATNRRFYAALLLHLYEKVFDALGDTPRVTDLIAEIGDFIDQYRGEDGAFDSDIDDAAGGARGLSLRVPKGQDVRRYQAYNTLQEHGWLIELKQRYRKLVNLSPEGRLLLRELHKIASGDVRSYGGVVLNVLGNLEHAITNPAERSEHLRNAWQFSLDFVQHLHTLSAHMHQFEEEILSQNEIRNFFRAFFADYISQSLITDYKTLYTKNNPFRLRGNILKILRDIEEGELLLRQLAEAYQREGRGRDQDEANAVIRKEVSDIYRVFDNVDHHLAIIDETQARIERRVSTVIRYMDRDGAGLLDQATRALAALGATDLADDDVIETQGHILASPRFLGEHALYRQRPPHRPIPRARYRPVPPDPALVAYERATLRRMPNPSAK